MHRQLGMQIDHVAIMGLIETHTPHQLLICLGAVTMDQAVKYGLVHEMDKLVAHEKARRVDRGYILRSFTSKNDPVTGAVTEPVEVRWCHVHMAWTATPCCQAWDTVASS